MGLTIEGTYESDGQYLDKRFYMPGVVLKSACPKCGAPWEMDLGHNYIKQYPVAGQPMTVHCYCGDDCEHEWDAGAVVIRVSLELVPLAERDPAKEPTP